MTDTNVVEAQFTESRTALAIPEPVLPVKSKVMPRLLTLDPEAPPWSMMKGEGAIWYARFDEFRRLLPAERTLSRVYRDERTRLKRPVAANAAAPVNWHERAKVWSWRDRAMAWDAYQREVRDVDERNAREIARGERINVLKGVVGKVVKGMQQLDPAEMRWSDVMRLPAVITALREEQGLPEDVKGAERDAPQIKVIVGVELERL